MRKFLLSALVAVCFVACDSEYDKMSEYDKAIHDVGISSKISADDALKNVEVWQAAKIIYSTEPCGSGEVHVIDYDNVDYYGGTRYYFSYNSKLRFYVYNDAIITVYDKGVDNPYYYYSSYYVDYNYKLSSNNNFELTVCNQLEEAWANPIKKMNLAAYNENCIVVDADLGVNNKYRYYTYILKPATMSDIKKWESDCFVDVESYVKWKNENEK